MLRRCLSRLPLLVFLWPAAAMAGRQPFNELLDNEVLPARGAELQSRITDVVGTPDGDDETALWWGAALALNSQVELLLPAEIAVSHADGSTHFTWYAVEARWRMAKPGPPPPPWHPVPLLRLTVERNIADQLFEGGVDLVVGTDLSPTIHSVVNVGGTVVTTGEEAATHGGVGITMNVSQAFRLGAEVFGEVPLLPAGDAPTIAAGPDLSFTLGQFWVTGGALFGLGTGRAYDASTRLSWGVEF